MLTTTLTSLPTTMERRYNELRRDWQNVVVISGVLFIHFANTGLKDIVRYTGVFLIKGFVTSEFHTVSTPPDSPCEIIRNEPQKSKRIDTWRMGLIPCYLDMYNSSLIDAKLFMNSHQYNGCARDWRGGHVTSSADRHNWRTTGRCIALRTVGDQLICYPCWSIPAAI